MVYSNIPSLRLNTKQNSQYLKKLCRLPLNPNKYYACHANVNLLHNHSEVSHARHDFHLMFWLHVFIIPMIRTTKKHSNNIRIKIVYFT